VIIDDKKFFNAIDRGRNVLSQEHLGANEILQMAGRVHGRVEGGRVFILSDRDIDFGALRPTEPEFQLAGDSERVALTCAALGVRADELELPMPLDGASYRRAFARLQARHVVDDEGRLSPYGRAVEALPVDRAWAELIVNADDDLVPYLAVMSSIESLHRMTREERDLDGVVVRGSDHLTSYNLYAEAYRESGYVGEVYGLARHLFDAERMERWAERRGVLVKSVEDAALAMASVYRSVGVALPQAMPWAGERVHRRFAELLAEYMPFDLVIDEETAWGDHARVSKTSVCGAWGAITGPLRYFADRFGVPRAGIEGTQLPADLLRRHAAFGLPELAYDARRKALVLTRRADYFGFELDREVEVLGTWDDEIAPEATRALADALARGEARHMAVRRNQPAIDEVREVYRRSGGRTPRLSERDLAGMYAEQLDGVRSLDDFRARPLRLNLDSLIDEHLTPRERERLAQLPVVVDVRDRDVDLTYEAEERDGEAPVGVVRLRLPEKLARTLVEDELPVLDRPLRFVVLRGPRGAVRADSLGELQELLDRPWSPDEERRAEEGAASERAARRDERKERTLANQLHRHAHGSLRDGGSRPDGSRPGGSPRGAPGGSSRRFGPGRGGRRK
ncbi:MAG: DEAD/DEAH box helicase, partial [Candidatus Eremiobacteraeota bacterium]|nr:DEAD/DEAH box helicase [Candidatus Eremiobacteraeota bacterium]